MTISIPVIRRPIPMIVPARTAPNNGDANTASESIMANMPTPIRKALEPPERVP